MPPTDENEAARTFALLQQVKGGLTTEQLSQLQLAESDHASRSAAILIAEDSDQLRTLMSYTLFTLGYRNITEAANGRIALELLRKRAFDLLILDIEMPVLDGYGVLAALRADATLDRLPVIVASGLGELDAVVRCIELGAEDFLPKPVNAVLLRARLGASLERKRLRDIDRLRLLALADEKQRLEIEQEKSERLLLNILPQAIADRLKRGEYNIAERYEDVTVLFADLVAFTSLVNRTGAEDLVALLNDLFSRFDRIAETRNLEKIKTVGDCYLVVGGLPEPRPGHTEAMAEMALDMLVAVADLNRERGTNLSVRIGMTTGPVVAGVIGRRKFAYDLWGATVNLANRMQSSGLSGRIHLPTDTARLLRGKFRFAQRGTIACKGLGRIRTCLLEGRLTAPEK
jgi:class 3 adenylate cyclase